MLLGEPMKRTVKSLILASGLACALAAAILLRSRVLGPGQPSGPGRAAVSLDGGLFAGSWYEGEIALVGVGDSITRGFGSREGFSYFDLLVRNRDRDYPDMKGIDLMSVLPKLTHLNVSENGSTSSEHVSEQIPLLKLRPAGVRGIAVVTSGGNDTIHDYGRRPGRDGAMYGASIAKATEWRPLLKSRIEMIVDTISERFPAGCEVFIANVYDPTDGVGDIENAPAGLPAWPDGLEVLAMVNAVIAEVAASRENVHLVDIRAEFLGHGIHCGDSSNPHHRGDDPTYWFYKNLEDPNERGYDAIRRAFLREMSRVLALGGTRTLSR